MKKIKDIYSKEFFVDFGGKIKHVWEPFDISNYVNEVFCEDWDNYEFMERVNWAAKMLNKFLSHNYEEDIQLLLEIAPECSYMQCSIFSEYIPVFGLEQFDISMNALEKMTMYYSSEFSVRPFIERYGEQAIDVILGWCDSDNEHVRRLASEGLRLAIPWGSKLAYVEAHPEKVIPILDKLKSDSSDYVRKSVANNINELSKKFPQLVINLTRMWYGKDSRIDRMLKHGCRTLIKKGNGEVLKIFGINTEVKLSIIDLDVTRGKKDDSMEFNMEFELLSNSEEKLLIQCELISKKNNQVKTCVKIAERKFAPGRNSYVRNIKISKAIQKVCDLGPYSAQMLVNGQYCERI